MGMHEVELVELDDQPAAEPVDEVDRARSAVRHGARSVLGWLRRHPALCVTAAACAVVAIAVPLTLSVRADHARVDARAKLTGVLDTMLVAPVSTWTAATPVGYFLPGLDGRAWIRDDALIVLEQAGGSSQTLRTRDVRTGDELWSVNLTITPGLADATSISVEDPTSCSATTDRIACLVPDSWRVTEVPAAETIPGTEATTVVRPGSLRLHTYAVRTGERVLDQPVAVHSSIGTLDGDVVVAQPPEFDDGPARLARIDPSTGATVWSVEVPRPSGVGSSYPWVDLSDGLLGVGWLGSFQQFAADGSAAGVVEADGIWHARGHRWSMGADNGLTDVDTGRRFLLGDSVVPWIRTDDGSVPEVLVVQDEHSYRGLSTTTGAELWSMPQPATGPATATVVVDGRLALLSSGLLMVRDLRTGEGTWFLDSPGLRGDSLVTDGSHLITIVAGVHRSVVAYDLRDGHVAWSVEIPASVGSLAVTDHRLFGLGDGITAFSDAS
jgi:outer membrane protein assembly factor BamB